MYTCIEADSSKTSGSTGKHVDLKSVVFKRAKSDLI